MMPVLPHDGTSAYCKRAVFLDKDGTLVHDVPYNIDPDKVRLTPHALEGLMLLQNGGYELFVVTNQAGVAKGRFPIDAWQRMQAYLYGLFRAHGVRISAFYSCPHHPQGSVAHYAVDCHCRKPMPGMLLRAAREHGLDLGRSWMIGDILHDVEAGKRAGCRSVLIDNGNETEWELTADRMPDVRAADLLEAAHAILLNGRNSHASDLSISRMNESMTE
jgi:D-glycero-D-manno-heptose 1,7-bisphosphate phosphatase